MGRRLLSRGGRDLRLVVFAGDGASDQEASQQADMVFAHRTLARFCDAEGIDYQPFQDFRAVLLTMRELHLNGAA